MSGEPEERRSALLGFAARTAGFGADSLNRAGCRPRSHGSQGHTRCPWRASSACWGPARARWARGVKPRESRLFAMIEALSLLGQESIPLWRMDYKANCSCLSSKAKKVRKPLLPSPESLKNFQADWSVPDGSNVTMLPPYLTWVSGTAQLAAGWDPDYSPSSSVC